MWRKDLERGIIFATGLMIANLVIGFSATLLLAIPLTGNIAGSAAFLELGFLFIIGGCLMSRQPLKDEDRYSDDGNPTSAWRMAVIGRQMIFAAVILFVYAAVVAILSLFYII